MNPIELAGLRPDDLTAEERVRRAELLLSNAEARAEAALADELGSLLAEEPTGGPTLAEVRASASRRDGGGRWALGIGLALAASVLLWVGLPRESGVRDRGVGPVPVQVRLSAVAEGPAGARPLTSGARVGPDERVVFWVDASTEGTLVVSEDGRRIHPTRGTWTAAAGAQVLGGDRPLAWRPDGTGSHAYQVELCDAAGTCVVDRLRLEWTE